jgi:acetyl-CoA decarbonylase/synthase complex subunit gamma
MIALEQKGDSARFVAAAKEIARNTSLLVALISRDGAGLSGALEALPGRRPLIYAADWTNFEAMAALSARFGAPLAVAGDSLDEIADLTGKLKQKGVEDLVLAPQSGGAGHGLATLTQLRRLALEKSYRPLGFPIVIRTSAEDPAQEALQAILYVCKYASILILRGRHPWEVLPILTARYNIYTDPQVPNAVEAKVYKVGEPGPDSPVLLTTNFALTYFTVEGEVENSRIPAYITVVDTGGLGILNSYADDKLTGEIVAKAVKASGVLDHVRHRKLIIPGLVAVLKGELEDETGCEVLVGPEEATGIPAFLKSEWRGAN